MKFGVFGAGAIGGLLAVQLARAGHQVCVIARGEHLATIRADGLTLRMAGAVHTVRLPASDDPGDFGPQDMVICALKAHQAWEAAERFAPLLGPETAVVTAMNGIPWWYFHAQPGPFAGHSLRTVDPDGRQWRAIGPARAIGCVVDPAAEVVAPGVVEHHAFDRFILGEPDGRMTPRVTALADALRGAGFDAPVRDSIRWNVWLKLLGNVCFNPLSLLVQSPVDRLATVPALRRVCEVLMQEARAVAGALGVAIPETMIPRRLDAARTMSGHRMSMLQDLERGRSLELDALVASVAELGRLTSVPTPMIDAVLALAQERSRQAGLYRAEGDGVA